IQAPSLRRDVTSATNDYFGLVLDTFNDRETSLIFAVTPAGVRVDAVLAADGQRPLDKEWNTFWDVVVTQTEEGWFAEMRIPFSGLRFQQVEGRVTMGMTLWRHIARKNEDVTFPAIPSGAGSIFRASQTQRVRFSNVVQRRPIYATPYVLMGAGSSHLLNSTTRQYQADDQAVREVGLDVKFPLTSYLTLDLTYNTDFAQ